MAPDSKNSLSDKILALEQQPVLWNKDEVWNMIHAGMPRRKHSSLYYYAAAVLVLLVISGVVLLKYESKDSVQDSISDQSFTTVDTPGVHTEMVQETEPAAPEIMKDVRPTVKPEDRPHNSSIVELATAEIAHAEIEPDVMEEVQPALEEATVYAKIEPIIGVYKDVVAPAVTKTKKRKLLHKLDSPESPAEFEYRNSTVVLARLK